MKLFLESNKFKFKNELNTKYRTNEMISQDKIDFLKKVSKENFILIKNISDECAKTIMTAPYDTVTDIFDNNYPVFADSVIFNREECAFKLVNKQRLNYPQKVLFFHNIDSFLITTFQTVHVSPFFTKKH